MSKIKQKSQCKTLADRRAEECKTIADTTKPLQHSTPVLDLPHFIRILGPKHFAIFRSYIPSLIIYGITTVIYTVYITEFKTVLQYLPYYNGRYVEPVKDPPKPKEKPKENTDPEE